MSITARPAGIALAAAASLVSLAAPAHASSDDVVRRGSCSGATDWKVKVGPDNGKLQIEGEIDSNHAGQTWRFRLLHNGATSASGTRTTKAPSGSFTVRKAMTNLAGTDTITLRARNVKNDEKCVGTVRF